MATLIDQEFFARLRALNDKFADSVPDTLARIAAMRARLDPQAPDMAVVGDIHQVLHTIAGSAATFGFRTFGQQARNLEQRLRVLMAFEESPASEWAGWLEALDRYTSWAAQDPKADYYDEFS